MSSMRSSAEMKGIRGWGQARLRAILAHDPSTWPGRAITWGPVLGLMGVIFWLSSLSQPFGPDPIWFDEVIGVTGHFCEYGLLALAWRWAIMRQWPTLGYPGVLALALTLGFALSDEFHQTFVPGRFADPLDILTDMAGAVTALWLWRRR